MNRSVSTGQRSLEITLVRQQVDSQAALLRHARDNNLPAWSTIKTGTLAPDGGGTVDLEQCPDVASQLPAGSFYMRPVAGEQAVAVVRANVANRFSPASSYSMVDLDPVSHRANGIWVVPVRVGSPATRAYDMYIKACWDSVGQTRPMNISTIVRLYDT